MNWAFLKNDAPRFFNEVEQFLLELNIFDAVSKLEADHFGLRFENPDTVTAVSQELRNEGTMIASAEVNGRQIQIIELAQPLVIGNRQIQCIELPYPKRNHTYSDGWEHVEFVISSNAETLDAFRAVCTSTFPNLDWDHLRASPIYSESVPSGDNDQRTNPTIALEKSKNLTIKFHPASIRTIVTGA